VHRVADRLRPAVLEAHVGHALLGSRVAVEVGGGEAQLELHAAFDLGLEEDASRIGGGRVDPRLDRPTGHIGMGAALVVVKAEETLRLRHLDGAGKAQIQGARVRPRAGGRVVGAGHAVARMRPGVEFVLVEDAVVVGVVDVAAGPDGILLGVGVLAAVLVVARVRRLGEFLQPG